jgi:hypothetical protein
MKKLKNLRKRGSKSAQNMLSRPIILTLALFFSLGNFSHAQEKMPAIQNQQQSFIKNQGQWVDEVQFLARINGMNGWITDKGIVYDLYKIERSTANAIENEWNDGVIKGHVIRMEFEGQSASVSYLPREQQEGNYNYFLGNDRSEWAPDVPLHHEVVARDVYQGIDSRYYFDGICVRYDMIIHPGADLTQIRMKYTGQDGMKINEKGELVLQTSLGDLEQKNIYAYQEIDGLKQEVSCRFQILENGSVSFLAAGYDRDLPLIIDPLVYSTFIGGSGVDYGKKIIADNEGNTYIAGYTNSVTYPVTTGAYQTTISGALDYFVTKLNATGSGLVYSTFIGGTGNEDVSGIALDNNGDVYLTGHTYSVNYPVVAGAYQTSLNGSSDAFVTKLNADGSALVYSTYIGGTGSEIYNADIAVDNLLCAYITGSTGSTDYPVTAGSYQTSFGGNADCYVTKLDPAGSSLVYSTYLGGSSPEDGFDISVDTDGNAYISGQTQSANYPVTTGAFQPVKSGSIDCFVTKLNASGSALEFSTFLGGSGTDNNAGIAIDSDQNVYISGNTNSTNFPVTTGSFQATIGGSADCFVTKMNPAGSALVYSTFIGGSAYEENTHSIDCDVNGNVFVTGYTSSSNFPVTPDAHQPVYTGNSDCFVTGLDASGAALLYSSYHGGTGADIAYGIDVDMNNGYYITGITYSSNFPVTPEAYQSILWGSADCFVSKFSYESCDPPVAICQDATVTLSSGGTASITPAQVDNGSYAPCGIQSMAVFPDSLTCDNIGPNNVTLTVTDINGDISECTSIVTVYGDIPEPLITVSPSPTVPGQLENTIYLGYGPQSVTLTATGGTTYSWTPLDGLSCADCNATEVSPTVTTTYTVTVTNEYGCTASASVTIYVIDVRCGNNMDKVLVCHKENTLCLAPNAAEARLKHGAYLGPCLKNGMIETVDPETLILENYPNPFNKSTVIEYNLPHDAQVVLRVYDMLSREVCTLVNSRQQAGKYTVELKADDLPDGIYTCLLDANGEKLKRIMIRMK